MRSWHKISHRLEYDKTNPNGYIISMLYFHTVRTKNLENFCQLTERGKRELDVAERKIMEFVSTGGMPRCATWTRTALGNFYLSLKRIFF